MKNRTGIAISVAFLTITVLVFVALIALNANNIDMNMGGIRGALLDMTFSTQEASAVRIDVASARVQIGRSADEEIHLTITDNINATMTQKDTLSIRQDTFFGLFIEEQYVTLLLPDGMDSVYASSASGRVQIENIACGEIDIKTASGRVECSDVSAQDRLSLHTASGRIEITNISADSVSLESTSGRITGDCAAADISAHAISGRLQLSLPEKCRLNATTTSGSIQIECEETVSGTIKSTSGSVKFDAPDEQSVRCSSTSGSIEIDGGRASKEYSRDNGGDEVSIRTTSGSIRVE